LKHTTSEKLHGEIKQTDASSRLTAHGMAILAYFMGATSLLALLIFLFRGPINFISLNLSESGILVMDGCLCIAFFLQHSSMTRRSFRRWLARFVGDHFTGAVYTVVSGFVLLALILLWQRSISFAWEAEGLSRWVLRFLFFVCLGGFYWGARALRSFDAFGIAPILRRLKGKKTPRSLPLVIRGPYRLVRHPLYFFCILLIWACPDISTDRLLFNILWTGWIVVGTMLEERDLKADFSDAYRDYQRKVPMLIPYRLPKKS
jgi:methanethiol S-methyltransferase